jgi:hypothetical protein
VQHAFSSTPTPGRNDTNRRSRLLTAIGS